MSAAGGAPTPLTRVADKAGATDRLPWFLPDGKRLLYFSGTQTSDKDKQSFIKVLDLASGKSTVVAQENSEGRYAEPGYLLFVREGNLMAQPLDPSSLKTTGGAVPIAEGVLFQPFRWFGNYTVSRTGRLVFQGSGAVRAQPADLVRRRRQESSAASGSPRTSSRSRSRPTPSGPP